VIHNLAFESALRAGLLAQRAGEAVHADWSFRGQGRIDCHCTLDRGDQDKSADDGSAPSGEPDQFGAKEQIVILHLLPPLNADLIGSMGETLARGVVIGAFSQTKPVQSWMTSCEIQIIAVWSEIGGARGHLLCLACAFY
jgi:hypothetical protein